MFDSQDRKIHFGLLIMRLGLTAVLFSHALPKLFAGAHSWKNIGTYLFLIPSQKVNAIGMRDKI